MAVSNPFTITFGKQPNMLISRYDDTDRIVSTFTAENVVSQTFLVEGLRGSGKTVLITSVAKQLQDRDGWIVINLNSAMDLLSNFAIRLNEECSNKPGIVSKGFNVSAAGFGLEINGEDKNTDYVGMIDKSFKTVIKKKKRVLITIDEVMNDENMRVFASQFQIFVRQDYPVFLIMTGLHENIFEIQNDPALTFLLRTPKITTGPLSILQITSQYKDTFGITDSESSELARLTKGYAFAFQALGVSYWENRAKGMDTVLKNYDALLDDFVYKKIWSTLSRKEREIMLTFSQDERKVGDICREINMSNSTFSKYREVLLAKSLIQASSYGCVSLTLPRFHEVVKNYFI